MGAIKSTAIKTLGMNLIGKYRNKFNEDFEHNKEAVNEVKPMKSKTTRNSVAGYITTKMRQIKKSGL